MEVTHTHCAGLDVHKKIVVACSLTQIAPGKLERNIRSFGTTTVELLALSDWLSSQKITHLAMESTGEYWKPIYNILESNLEVMVVNAQHLKNVPGRKTDVKDAEWIAELLRHGLLRGSFIPPLAQRDLRDLTRQRITLVRERARVVNRLQKVLEWANLKLGNVVTDITGVSARRMLQGIVEGQTNVRELAALAKGSLVRKQEQLQLWFKLLMLRFAVVILIFMPFIVASLVAEGERRRRIAVAHRILIALYHMLTKHEPYQDLGVDYLSTQSQQQRSVQRLRSQARQLGYQVELTPLS